MNFEDVATSQGARKEIRYLLGLVGTVQTRQCAKENLAPTQD